MTKTSLEKVELLRKDAIGMEGVIINFKKKKKGYIKMLLTLGDCVPFYALCFPFALGIFSLSYGCVNHISSGEVFHP